MTLRPILSIMIGLSVVAITAAPVDSARAQEEGTIKSLENKKIEMVISHCLFNSIRRQFKFRKDSSGIVDQRIDNRIL